MSGEVLALPIDILAPRSEAWPAFEAAYRDYGARLKSMAYNLLGNQQDAEDAVQEAFLKAYRAQAEFRTGAAVHTWIFRILVNVCLDEGRRRQRRPVVEAGVELAGRAESPDLRMALRHALDLLPDRQRAVFLMASVEGLPHADIAAILEISESNSRTLLLEARRQLQATLTK